MPGRGRGERRPPPGTPGVSSGVQVKLHQAWRSVKLPGFRQQAVASQRLTSAFSDMYPSS